MIQIYIVMLKFYEARSYERRTHLPAYLHYAICTRLRCPSCIISTALCGRSQWFAVEKRTVCSVEL